MNHEQGVVSLVLGTMLVLFAWGRLRHDIVALLSLLCLVLAGVVPGESAFQGFGHPAVITVAAVLVISRGIRNTGLLDAVSQRITAVSGHTSLRIGMLAGVTAGISAVINNVGALALLLPVARDTAEKSNVPPSRVLMPLSFAAILGGMITMIGTPPNIIVAAYRGEIAQEPFRLLDFSWVGLPVATAGILFVTFIGWRLLPEARQGRSAPEDLFRVQDYMTEATVPLGSAWAGRTVSELEALADGDVVVVAIIRGPRRFVPPGRARRLREKDVLLLRSDPADLGRVVDQAGLELNLESQPDAEALRSDLVGVVEALVPPGSRAVGTTPRTLRVRSGGEINLLSVARQGRPLAGRLRDIRFRGGDLVLLHGPADAIPDRIAEAGLLPLAGRLLRVGKRRYRALAVGVLAVGLALAAWGVLPAALLLAAVAVAYVVLDLVSARTMYEVVDWPVIVLLGAMIPVGEALQSTGTTTVVATWFLGWCGELALPLVLGLILVATMTLSDVINNAATAVVMAPLAASIAVQWGVSPDPFLMAVAVGASCAFLTPIGHQCNLLVMGPGGYRFGDYWRMGLPLEVLIVLVAIPIILVVWVP